MSSASLPSFELRAELLELCTAVAARGAEVLMDHAQRRSGLPREHQSKGRRRELVTAADRAAEFAIVDAITAARPDDAILAEEGVRTEAGVASSAADWLWIVDPLDGTTNFVHAVPWFSVSVALYFRGAPLAAAVHAPALGHVWTAAAELGARRDGQPISIGRTDALADALVATGFSYNRNEPGRDDNVERIRRLLPHCRDLRRYGSAAMDLCLVADGTWDGYWEMYLAPYDVAAGALLVREAGGIVTDLCGGEDWLFGGQILASNRDLHAPLLTHVGGAPMV